MAYPDWVEKYRMKGTNISCIRGKYYLYECTSKYDPKKKRSQKITTKYLGRITEEGLIPPKKKKEEITSAAVREYGASEALLQYGSDIYEKLKKHFPEEADMLFVMADLRLTERCPLRSVGEAYQNSFLSEKFSELKITEESISAFLHEFGHERREITDFLNEFVCGSDYFLYRKRESCFNILTAVSADNFFPAYYIVIAPDTSDAEVLRQCAAEYKAADMTVFSEEGRDSFSIDSLERSGLRYIVLTLRESKVTGEKIRAEDISGYEESFTYEGRTIYYYARKDGNHSTYVYLDPELKAEELFDYDITEDHFADEKPYKGKYSYERTVLFTNTDETPEKIFALYRTRCKAEKNPGSLDCKTEPDAGFLDSERAVETWAFINHISMMLAHRIYSRLRECGISEEFTVTDAIQYLSYIKNIKINDTWVTGEITSGVRVLSEKLGLSFK